MPEWPPDFGSLLRAVDEQGVQYLLIGGLAMIAHGSAHLTTDLDIACSREPENLPALVAGLKPLHPHLRGAPEDLPSRWDVRTLRAGTNFTLVADMDLLGYVAGADSFGALWDRA